MWRETNQLAKAGQLQTGKVSTPMLGGKRGEWWGREQEKEKGEERDGEGKEEEGKRKKEKNHFLQWLEINNIVLTLEMPVI